MKIFYSTILVSLICGVAVAQTPVTFKGMDLGPFVGEFRQGQVTGISIGKNLVPGGFAPAPNSLVVPFDASQIVAATDVADSGAEIRMDFKDAVITAVDYVFVTNIRLESNVVLSAFSDGVAVDADWTITESLGELTFDDDGDGLNATIGGTTSIGSVLVSPSTQNIDEIIVSWIGNGPNNQGVQVGLAVGFLLGDVNLDGSVDLLDVAPFVDLLTDGGFQAEADINQDGVVDLLDVAPFVDLLTGN